MAIQASRVSITQVPPSIPSQAALEVAVALGIGVTEFGPVNTPVALGNFDEFRKIYGGYLSSYELALQVDLFFREGGRKIIINRVHALGQGAKFAAMLTTGATAVTKGSILASNVGPYSFVNGDTLICAVDAAANQILTITGAAAADVSAAENFAANNGQTLTVVIDSGAVQTVTLSGVTNGAVTALQLVDNLNAGLVGCSAAVVGATAVLTSDTLGSASKVEITGGTASAAVGFGAAATGTGNVTNLASISATALAALAQATFTNGGGVLATSVGGALQIEAVTGGSAGSVKIDVGSSLDDDLGMDNVTHAGFDGTSQNTLQLQAKYVGAPTVTYSILSARSGVASEFDLLFYKDGKLLEEYANLTMDSASTRYVTPWLLANSNWLVGIDQSALGTALQRRPQNATAGTLSGGNAGLAGLATSDYLGVEADLTGLHAFNAEVEGQGLMCPDEPTVAFVAGFDTWAKNLREGRTTLFPDAPAGQTASTAVTHEASLVSSYTRIKTPFPLLKIPNPDRAIYTDVDEITVKTSGSILGIIARNAQTETTNIATQPGNELFGRFATATGISSKTANHPTVQDILAGGEVNVIVAKKDSESRYGVWLNDVLGGDQQADFTTIGELMLVNVLKTDLWRYLEKIRNTPNTEANRRLDQKRITAYLERWAERDVFDSKVPGVGYYVDTDPAGEGLNNATIRAEKRYRVLVGVNTASARRIVDLLFTRDTHGTTAATLKAKATL